MGHPVHVMDGGCASSKTLHSNEGSRADKQKKPGSIWCSAGASLQLVPMGSSGV